MRPRKDQVKAAPRAGDSPGYRSRTVVTAFLLRAGIVFLSAVTGIVLSRALLPEGRGAYAVLASIGTLTLSVGHLSIENAQSYLWSQRVERSTLAANAVVLGLVNGSVAALLSGLAVWALGEDVVPIEAPWLLVVTLLAVPLGTVALYFKGLLYVSDHATTVYRVWLAAAAFQCGLLVGLALVDRLSVAAVVIAWSLTTVAPLLLLTPALRVRSRDFDRTRALQEWRLGLRYHAGVVALFLLLRIDILLLNGLSNPTEVGLYSLAVTLAEMTYVASDTVAYVALPKQMDIAHAESARYTVRVARTNVAIAVGGFVVVALLAPVLIPIAYGGAFAPTTVLVWLLGPGIVAFAVARVSSGFLLRVDRPLRLSAIAIFALAVNVGLAVILIPSLGGAGAAIASSVAYVALAVPLTIWLSREAGVSFREFAPRVSDVRDPLRAVASQLLENRRSAPGTRR